MCPPEDVAQLILHLSSWILLFARKLSLPPPYPPSLPYHMSSNKLNCIASHRSASSGHNFLLASKDGTLSVFVNFNLVWAAKLPTVPVQMAVSDFGGQKGLVVTLDDTGRLSIGFLGTKPPLSAVPSLTSANAREVDYDRLDEEHRGLLQVQRSAVQYSCSTLPLCLSIPVIPFHHLPYPSFSIFPFSVTFLTFFPVSFLSLVVMSKIVILSLLLLLLLSFLFFISFHPIP